MSADQKKQVMATVYRAGKMAKTFTGDVVYTVRTLTGKVITRTTRLLVHDENNDAQIGDVVEIRECRPISRRKAWTLVRVLRRHQIQTGESAS